MADCCRQVAEVTTVVLGEGNCVIRIRKFDSLNALLTGIIRVPLWEPIIL
jgi:hypothetical protein